MSSLETNACTAPDRGEPQHQRPHGLPEHEEARSQAVGHVAQHERHYTPEGYITRRTSPAQPHPATVCPLVTACTSIRRVATAALLAMTAMALPRAAGADPISAKKAQAERLAAQIATLGAKESALAERYNQATLNAADVQAKVDQAKVGLAQAAKATDAARARVKS